MTATYNRFPCRHVWRSGLHCCWEITDGIGGPLLADGRTWTRHGADSASEAALLDCEPSLALRLERVADQLTREGLPVAVRLDERDRPCVRAMCPCSDVDHRRVMKAFVQQVGPVRWEVARG